MLICALASVRQSACFLLGHVSNAHSTGTLATAIKFTNRDAEASTGRRGKTKRSLVATLEGETLKALYAKIT